MVLDLWSPSPLFTVSCHPVEYIQSSGDLKGARWRALVKQGSELARASPR